MVAHVLVPMDGSPLSKRALDVALAENPDADVTALHVIDPSEPGYSYSEVDGALDLDDEPLHGSREWYARAQAYADDLFEDVRATANEHRTDVETALVVGSVGREIVDYANKHDVDHVILGSHGREDPDRVLLGSVTEAVVYRSPVRVTLVR